MRFQGFGYGLGLLAYGLASAAGAQSTPRLSQTMFVERLNASGTSREVEPAAQLRKGDRVILIVKWNSAAPGASFTVSSAVPKHLAYERSSLRVQTVSTDGGRNWGEIGALTVKDGTGTRLASVEDVTHLRWKVPAARAASGNGTITYSAIVR